MKIEVKGFIPCYDAMIERHGLLRAAIYGRIERFSWKYGHCFASKNTIADALGISHQTARTHIKALIEDGYITDLDEGVGNRPHRLKPTGKADLLLSIEAIDKGLKEVDTGIKEIDTGLKEIDTGLKEIETNIQSNTASKKETEYDVPEKLIKAFEAWKEYTLKPDAPVSSFQAHIEPLTLVGVTETNHTETDFSWKKTELLVRCRKGDRKFISERVLKKGYLDILKTRAGIFNIYVKLVEEE